MRNIYDVIRQKEAEMQQLQKELDALRLAARLLSEETKVDLDPARPLRMNPVGPSATKTDGEIVIAAPLRQFP